MKVLVGLLVAGAVIALAFFIVRGIRETTATASAIHDGVLEPYLELLKQERFEDAYEACLSEELRKRISSETFVSAHRARVRQFGALEAWRHTTVDHEANLFESVSRIGLRFVLTYAHRDVHVLYLCDADEQPYEILEILGSEGSSDSLRPGIW